VAWVTPHVFAVGEILTSASMNVMQSNLAYLHDVMDYEVGFASTNSTTTVGTSATDLLTLGSLTFDGVTQVSIEYFAPVYNATGRLDVFVYDNGTSSFQILANFFSSGTTFGVHYFTPTNGAHVFKTVGVNSTTGAQIGGSTASTSYLRLKVAP